jgi:hypothetical protein
VASVAWNFWEANAGDEKERGKLERSMYEQIAPLPFSGGNARDLDGWTFGAWVPGERGVVNRG